MIKFGGAGFWLAMAGFFVAGIGAVDRAPPDPS